MRRWLPSLVAMALLEACGPVPGTSDAGSGMDASATPDGGADAAPDVPPGTGAILGRVRVAGASDGLAGVTVRREGGVSVVTDAHGFFVLSAVPEGPRVTVVVDHPGYAPAIEPVAVEGGAVSEMDVVLVRFSASAQIDPSVGGRVTDPAGGQALIPPNALVTAEGRPVTGMVTVSIAPIDPSDSAQMASFPGDFTATRSDGSAVELETYVPMVIDARQGSTPVQLATGMAAELTLPVPAGATERAPDRIEFWRLDPATGQWREEGMADRAPNPAVQGRVVYRAPIRRMGWWNCDRPMQTTCVRGCVRAPDGRPFPRARVQGRGVDYYGNSGAVTSPSTGCFAMDVKRAARVAVTASSGGLSSAAREVMTSDAPMRAATARDNCQDLGVIELAAPVPNPCETGMSLCGERCVNPRSDRMNCGACGSVCPAGLACVDGACGCGPEAARCGDRCTVLSTDSQNCGACGNVCAAGLSCVNGACACPAGQTRCGDRCVDTRTDANHCGACGNACAPGVRCNEGACQTFDAGVDVPRDTGVDVPRDTGVDVVDVPRDTGPTCPPGRTYCVADCVDLATDARNCGDCGNACPGGTNGVGICAARTCALQCFSGYGDCDGNRANGCETVLMASSAHCGACGRACTAPTGGDATCAMGTCRASCPTGRSLCGSACVDTLTDAANCGACGSACPSGQRCESGACATPETPFRISSLSTAECRLNEHSALSGSSQGGILYYGEQVIHAGSTGTAVFDPGLVRGTLAPARYPALVGTVNGLAFTLANGTTPLGATGGVADGLLAINYNGVLGTRRVALSTPITITTGTGFFAGQDRVMIHAGGRVWDIHTSTGRVTDRGALTLPAHPTCGGLGYWGVAENYLGQYYLDLVQNRTTIARVRISDGQVTPLATFTDLGSSCAFGVGYGMWFIASDGPSDFAPSANVGASHVVGCSATLTQPIVLSGHSVSAGQNFTCATRSNGALACWGTNAMGQLGDNTTVTPRLTPTTVLNSFDVVSVAAGNNHACALQSTGRVLCWGDNTSGQLGNNTTTSRRVWGSVVSLSDAVEIAAGANHTCARKADGTVVCWGNNAQGQLGDGTISNRLVPTAVPLVADARALAAGSLHTCAAVGTGGVLCWGNNAFGQLGIGSLANQARATPVSGLTEVSELAAGQDFTCARWGGGNVSCWGNNSAGQLGDGSTMSWLAPNRIPSLTNALRIAAGGQHACARTTDDAAMCWGNTAIGDGSAVIQRTPVRASLDQVAEVTAGNDQSCARLTTGAVRCWGENVTGQLGDGTTTRRLTPVPVTGL